jgi:small-conductance mechanosensitive channel/CRP-like cAMP-binding protein
MTPDALPNIVELERQNLFVALGALGLFLTMVIGHRLIFKGWQGKSDLGRAVRDRLRWLSFPLLIVVPLWWAATQLDSLFFVSAELFLISGFLCVVMVLEALRTLLTQRYNFSEGAMALLLYVVPTFVFLMSILQIDVLEGATGYALGTVLVLFLFLHLVYAYLFRWVPWKHPLSTVLRKRLGPWVYLGIIGMTFYFAVLRYPGLSVGEHTLSGLGGGLALLGVLVASEALLATIFDFYFPVARKSEVPTLFRDLVRGLVYIGLFLAFVGFVLKRDLDSLLVGSAVITVSIGFALQETLGNFFAGLALRLSRPYALGDFVQVGSIEGRVDKIDWRQTSVFTFTGDYVIVPNSMLAKEAINNYSSPTTLHARDIRVGLHYRHPPNQVIEVMKAVVAEVDSVLSSPAPEFHLLDFDDSSVNYRIRFWIKEYERRFQIDTDVRVGLWYAFNRRGLEIPFPIRTLVQEPVSCERSLEHVLGFLSTVDFLEALGPETLAILAEQARFQLFAAGEKICVQGEPGDCFYIIRDGRVEVNVKDAQGETILSFEMATGNYFGEMALLTGEPRSATVSAVTDAELLTVSKADLKEVIVAHPEVEKIISKVLAQRQLRTEQAQQEAEEERATRTGGQEDKGGRTLEQLSEQLLRKIQAFFSY